jgi:hypothetical protein
MVQRSRPRHANGPKPLPFLPPLSFEELRMLREHPYEQPGPIKGTRRVKIAQGLIDRGLLESDPSALLGYAQIGYMIIRCTDLGERAATPLSQAAALRVLHYIIDNMAEDPEVAAGLERELWQRVLLETAESGESRLDTRALAEIALRSAAYEFPRGY